MEAPPAIYYHVDEPKQASGETVVLLNGGMMSWFAWAPIAEALAEHYRVVRLDFRGQLQSPGLPPTDLAGHAADVVSVLDHLHIAKAHLVGTSFGALVGLYVAAEHPERVASLVAMNATAHLDERMNAGTRELRRLAREAAAGGDGGKILDFIVPSAYSPEWIAANTATLAIRRSQVLMLPKAYFEGLDGVLAAIDGVDPSVVLAKVRVPVTVVAGEKDQTFPLPNAEELARGIAGARLVVVPGAPHGMVLEMPEATKAAILDALTAISEAP